MWTIVRCNITHFYRFLQSALGKKDDIRVSITNADSYTLLCEIYIFVEGKVNVGKSVGEFAFTNNCFLK